MTHNTTSVTSRTCFYLLVYANTRVEEAIECLYAGDSFAEKVGLIKSFHRFCKVIIWKTATCA